jgi:hypothetical protein
VIGVFRDDESFRKEQSYRSSDTPKKMSATAK